jgi:multidrug efflux pump subunit AcrA (membrane-fusion protein)
MKTTITVLSIAVLILSACGSNAEGLDKLIKKRDELKKELAEVEQKISELDTTKTTQDGLLVTWEEVKIGSFIHQIEVQGSIETDRDVLLNAESGGLIQSILVKEGQRVRKGQTLIQIDAQVISSSIEELKTAMEFADYNYKKQKELFDQGLGSEFQLTQAKNNMDNLKSRLSGLNTQRGKFSITAPFDGVVDDIIAKVGAMAGPQAPVLRLVDNTEIKIIGTRHGEKLYETLVTREEMAKAEDLNGYYRIPMDNRDLNYNDFFSRGNLIDETVEEYHSHNTELLDQSGMINLLMKLDEVQFDISLMQKNY